MPKTTPKSILGAEKKIKARQSATDSRGVKRQKRDHA